MGDEFTAREIASNWRSGARISKTSLYNNVVPKPQECLEKFYKNLIDAIHLLDYQYPSLYVFLLKTESRRNFTRKSFEFCQGRV